MQIQLSFSGESYRADLSRPLNIGLPLSNEQQVKCFYAPDFVAEPLLAGDFVGAVSAGAPVNFFNVRLNPHGNGTHTECMGHISAKGYTINQQLKQFHFFARLISLAPEKIADDAVINKALLQERIGDDVAPALLIRTLPNNSSKQLRDYSGTNPPYLTAEAAAWLAEKGVEHLLLDIPSIDREEDGGQLAGHKAYWQFPSENRLHCTVTELIFVPDHIEDGLYLLNLQIAAFELDATPSKPVLYRLEKMGV